MNRKELIKKVKDIEWEWEWSRKCSLLVNYAVIKAWIAAPKKLGWKFNNIVMLNKDYYTNSFISKRDLEKAGEHVYKLSLGEGFLDFYEKNAKKACQRIIKASKPDLHTDILDQYNEWVNAYIEILYFVACIRLFNRVGERKLKEFIKSKIKNPKEQADVFSVLTATTKRNAFADFHQQMKEAYQAKRKGNNNKLKKSTSKIVKDFKWMPVGYGDEPEWTAKDIEKQLEDFRPLKEQKTNKEEVIKKLNPSQEIIRLIEVIDLFVYYKDYLRRVCNYCHYYSRPIFVRLGKKYNVNFKDVKMLMPEEIGKVRPHKSSVMFCDNGKIHIFDYVKQLEEELFSRETKEITGTVANVGKVRGNVVIINQPEHLKKDYNGCILVSVMTSPELTAAIKKSKAIVTDEGGITCHAAIVSREMGIPCIIGTKIATKVLKDNDLVEVDANKGIVRKLK